MKKFLLGFLFGLLAGAGGYWYLNEGQTQGNLQSAREKIAGGAGKVKSAIQETVGEIKAEDIKEELSRSSTVVREKAKKAGEAIADATADARTTAAIKAKLLKEPGLSSLSISVDTSDGLVTLSGTANSHEEIAKAVTIALNTDGVRKVISTLQVKTK